MLRQGIREHGGVHWARSNNNFDLCSELCYGGKVFLFKLHLVDKIADSVLEAFGDTTKNEAESNLKL